MMILKFFSSLFFMLFTGEGDSRLNFDPNKCTSSQVTAVSHQIAHSATMTDTKSEFCWFSGETISVKTMYHVGVERDEVLIQLNLFIVM